MQRYILLFCLISAHIVELHLLMHRILWMGTANPPSDGHLDYSLFPL